MQLAKRRRVSLDAGLGASSGNGVLSPPPTSPLRTPSHPSHSNVETQIVPSEKSARSRQHQVSMKLFLVLFINMHVNSMLTCDLSVHLTTMYCGHIMCIHVYCTIFVALCNYSFVNTHAYTQLGYCALVYPII